MTIIIIVVFFFYSMSIQFALFYVEVNLTAIYSRKDYAKIFLYIYIYLIYDFLTYYVDNILKRA